VTESAAPSLDGGAIALSAAVAIIVAALVVALVVRWMGALNAKRVLLAATIGAGLTAALCGNDIEVIVGAFGQGMDRYASAFIDAAIAPKDEAAALTPAMPEFESTPQARPPSLIASQWVAYLLRNIPFASVVAIAVTWILASVLSVLLLTIDSTGLRWGAGVARARTLSPQTRGRAVIGLVFGLSIYLSLAALVAFPWFKEEPLPETLNAVALGHALQQALSPEAETVVVRVAPSPLPMPEVRNLLKEEPGSQQLDPALAAFCRAEQLRAEELRNDLLVRLEGLREQVGEAKEQARRAAQQQYAVTTQLHMTQQERTVFFARVVDWHRARVTRLEQRLRGATLALNKLDAKLRTWSTRVGREVRRVGALEPESLRAKEAREAWNASEIAWFRATGPGGVGQEYEELFEVGSSGDDRIRLPGPGDEFGPFGLVANWLLRTRSEALAILTGMLGFGLFGALIARFVRGRPISDMWTSGEWPMVIVQGFSAALVVFLAVQGGMNAFSTGDQEANPYTLCLACLIGAVFSERVWAWARERISAIARRADQGAEKPI
jgi:hypothetical protein